MDTSKIESLLKEILFNNSVTIRVFDIFKDEVTEYGYEKGSINALATSSFTDYVELVKTKIDSDDVAGVMNLLSIPKIKSIITDGKSYASYDYKALDGKLHRLCSIVFELNSSEAILNIDQVLSGNVASMGANEKYDALIDHISDSIIKINNAFSLDTKKSSVETVNNYINSIFNELTNSYPELKKQLNSAAANVSGRTKDVLLIVDDDALTRNMIKKIFDGTYDTVMASNGKEAIEYLESNSKKGRLESSDNILGIFLDLTMPVMDGFSVLEYLSKNNYLYKIPVIIISGDYEKETKVRVYNYGIADMLEKPFDFDVVRHRIGKFIDLYKSSNSLGQLVNEQTGLLRDIINPIIENYNLDYNESVENIKQNMIRLGKQILKDSPDIQLYEENIEKMADAARYYDIGFYSVPKTILKKKDVSSKELAVIKKYPLFSEKVLGYVLSLISDAEFKNYANNIAKYYHENYDGSGYPNGLKDNEIPIEAQIAAICISYNNMIRKGKSNALDIIKEKKGIMFNPSFVDSFEKIIK